MATNDDDQLVLVEPSEADERRGPHGWVRIVLALVLGLLAGAVIALLLPREDGPRRVARGIADPAADPALADPRTRPASSTRVEGGPGTTIEG